MTKLQKALQDYYERDKGDGSIAGLIGCLEARKVIAKEEADYIMELLYRHTKELLSR